MTYRIRVSAGYDDNFTQIMKSMTYKPKPGMSQRQIKAEVNRQAVLFEEQVRQEQAEKKKRKPCASVHTMQSVRCTLTC